ncbi:MAG: zinc ABC transporter substrate-binding protein [Pirellulales bacterium]|nr:zinc ABC transporter substrate-binding protein [Pirellulales bacterium]
MNRRLSLVRCLYLAAATAGGLWMPGCGAGDSRSDDPAAGSLRVVCTTGQIADMLRNIGGPHVTVDPLMGPGVDPHLYKATPGDIRKLNSADAVFYNGLHLEGRLADLLQKLARRRPAYAVTDGVRQNQSRLLREIPGSEAHYDPHVWLDVLLWARCVEYAAEKLIALDAEHADDYRRRADAYLAELAELHESCRQRLSEIPKVQRVMVTAHDAFGYFGDAYDVEVHGLQGISTADETDLATANRLVDMLVKRRIKSVFVESSVPPKNIRSLVEACAARGHTVRVCEKELYSDALGPGGTPAETYAGMVRYNVETIVEALK